jgi:hypothetical protein
LYGTFLLRREHVDFGNTKYFRPDQDFGWMYKKGKKLKRDNLPLPTFEEFNFNEVPIEGEKEIETNQAKFLGVEIRSALYQALSAGYNSEP